MSLLCLGLAISGSSVDCRSGVVGEAVVIPLVLGCLGLRLVGLLRVIGWSL